MALPACVSADPAVVCAGLAAAPDTGANYTFTATASGSSDLITGYTFDFGDHQSYTVSFSRASKPDSRTATVTHAYQKDGVYAAQVHINAQNNGKLSSVSSRACQTSLTIGSPSGILPNTGAGDTAGLFIAAALVSIGGYQLWLRRRIRATPPQK
jgi:LPXTG-motif cell wall-anchored protein